MDKSQALMMSITKLSKYFGNRGRGLAALWPVLVSGPAFWGPALSQSRYPWPEWAVAVQVCLQADLAALLRSAMGMLFSNIPKSVRANIEVVQKWQQDIAKIREDSAFHLGETKRTWEQKEMQFVAVVALIAQKWRNTIQSKWEAVFRALDPYKEPVTCSTRVEYSWILCTERVFLIGKCGWVRDRRTARR